MNEKKISILIISNNNEINIYISNNLNGKDYKISKRDANVVDFIKALEDFLYSYE